MSLTLGSSPFGPRRGTWSFTADDHVWYLEDRPRRMRAVLGDQTVLDTGAARVLHETRACLVHRIPLADVRRDLLVDRGSERVDERTGPRRARRHRQPQLTRPPALS